MIILITGSTHTGKTFLAQRLLEKHHYPYLSVDHIKMGLIRSGICPLSPESGDGELTDYLWPVVREIIKTCIENNQNLIVEGRYIPFDYQKDFTGDDLAQIRFVCLLFSASYIEAHFDEILAFENVVEKRIGGGYCTKELLLRENTYNYKICTEHSLNHCLIDDVYAIDFTL